MLSQYDKPLLKRGLQKAFKSMQVLTAMSSHKERAVTGTSLTTEEQDLTLRGKAQAIHNPHRLKH